MILFFIFFLFLQIDKYSNRIASVFQSAGYVKGDAVALFMPNKPEYVATWLGLGKIGVVTALINTNLRLQSLVHCLSVAKVKAIIYADELAFGECRIIHEIEVFFSFLTKYIFFFFVSDAGSMKNY